jgi:beta-phosphoglucomutase
VIFDELAGNEATIFEGVPQFLQMLTDNKIRRAICSGALLADIAPILQKSKLGHFFEEIVSAEHIEKGKPDPEGFLLALKRLNEGSQNTIVANECVVIEDSHWGLEAAIAAGMHTVAITNTYDAGQLTMAEKIVERFSELTIDDLQQLCA